MVDGAHLHGILQQEAAILEKMIDLEEETQYLLVRGESSELEKLTVRKEKLVARMAELEKQRKDLLPTDITLEQYLAAEKPRNRKELQGMKNFILQLHTSLQKKLKVNRYLLRHNLHFTRQAVNYLFPGIQDNALYASSGEKKGEQLSFPAGLVDSNA